MTKKTTAIVWWSVGALALAGIVWGIIWLARPVSTIAGYPLDKPGANDHVEGVTNNPAVTLIEYSDFECPYCAEYHAIVKQLPALYPTQLAIVYRDYPLVTVHANAQAGAQAAEAAGKQGKFWDMHNLLFENQNDWANLSNPTTKFDEYAQQLGLDMTKYHSDYSSSDVKNKINADVQSGNAAKVSGTPTFFLNGKSITPGIQLSDFKTLIDEAIKNAPLTNIAQAPAVHIHANIKVYVNGTAIDFSQAKYQKTTDGKDLNEDVHFHDNNGDVVHVHKAGVTLNDLLTSFGMDLQRDCLTLDASTTKCATGDNKLRLYVNGQLNSDYGAYVFKDLDRILVTYGSENDAAIQKQISSVADNACIYSKTCPERGTPPAEDCAGGSGTNCT